MIKRLLSLSVILIMPLGNLFCIPQERIVSFSNSPNPFDSRNEATAIIYYLQDDAETVLKIYDLFGYPVKEYSFCPGENGARRGWNRIVWNGENEIGRKVAKGGYVCYLSSGSSTAMHKIGVIH